MGTPNIADKVVVITKYPLRNDLAWCGSDRTSGRQFRRSDEKEFAGVLQNHNGYSGRLNASAIAYSIEQPADVEIDEIVIRPTAQDF